MVVRGLLVIVAALMLVEPAPAQLYSPWNDGPFWDRKPRRPSPWFNQPWEDPFQQQPPAPAVRSGGPRPAVAALEPPIVPFLYDYPANSIVIDSSARKLYFVLDGSMAYEYAISVGREGFDWTGTETISRVQDWPDWHPPAEMRARDPKLPIKMTGGLRNPLGAKALYLGSTLYRIHGTNDAKSIGQAASSGCFRMLNGSVAHLASLAVIGTPVTVVATLGAPKTSEAPKPTPASTHTLPDRSSLGGPSGEPGPVDRDGLDVLPDPRARPAAGWQ